MTNLEIQEVRENLIFLFGNYENKNIAPKSETEIKFLVKIETKFQNKILVKFQILVKIDFFFKT